MPTRDQTPIDRMVAEHRADAGPEQASLPILAEDAGSENLAEARRGASLPILAEDAGSENLAEARRGRGRPFGSFNLRAERQAQLIRAELAVEEGQAKNRGDPLRAATRIAVIDITDPEQLEHYAKLWGCSKFEVVKAVAVFNRDVLPYHHQQLPKAVVVQPGAPGGDRVLVDMGDGDYVDVTPEAGEGTAT